MSLLRFGCLVIVVLGCLACAPSVPRGVPAAAHRSADERAIRAILQRFPTIRAADEEAALYADDTWFTSVRTPEPLLGREVRRESIAARRRTAGPDESTTFDPGRIVVAASGDVAYDYGRYRTTWTGPTGSQQVQGVYLRTWRKVEGEWKIAATLAQRRP